MAYKKRKRKVVLASGVFDLLHLGHVRFLEDAKRAGGEDAKLVVIVARDSTVEKTKGKKPIMSENERLELVGSLRVVDRSMLGHETLGIGEVIDEVKPDIIALGYDQDAMAAQVQTYVKSHQVPVEVIRIGKFGQNTLDSSTKIKQKIIEKLAN